MTIRLPGCLVVHRNNPRLCADYHRFDNNLDFTELIPVWFLPNCEKNEMHLHTATLTVFVMFKYRTTPSCPENSTHCGWSLISSYCKRKKKHRFWVFGLEWSVSFFPHLLSVPLALFISRAQRINADNWPLKLSTQRSHIIIALKSHAMFAFLLFTSSILFK